MRSIKQRIFYPFPNTTALWGSCSNGGPVQWNYIDPSAMYHTWMYDTNDISPYTEFRLNTSYVTRKFFSYRYHTAGDSLFYGKEGRTVLGCNDDNNAVWTLSTYNHYPYQGTGDTLPKCFAANLEFNIDDSMIDMDSSMTSDTDKVPLVRIQLAFLTNPNNTPKSVLPYVPFKTASDTTKSGWYLVVDTTITRGIYRSLDTSWREPDVLNGNTANQAHTWRFKQLHVIVKPNSAMSALINSGAGVINAGNSTDTGVAFSPPSPPAQDSIIHLLGALTSNPLLEMEVLSTFRATIRIRSLEFQDTIADKLFYRKRFASLTKDSTHSLNLNGTYGGLDDSLAATVATVVSALQPGTVRGLVFDDYSQPDYNSCTAAGLLDYFGSKSGKLYVHFHMQDLGGFSTQFRRERISYDGVPPSMFEDESGAFYTTADYYTGAADCFPLDYVYRAVIGNIQFDSTWKHPSDYLYNLLIARSVRTGTDSLVAYEAYTNHYAGLRIRLADHVHRSVRGSLWHPASRRMATEEAIQGWGDGTIVSGFPAYDQRPTTPEETIGETFSFIANGASALNCAQAFDFGNNLTAMAPGLFCPPSPFMGYASSGNQDTVFAHDYNFGHLRLKYYPGTQSDGVPKSWYLGYSNMYRAYIRVVQRINQIYPTLKTLTNIGAYSQHLTTGAASYPDSIVRSSAFLKVTKTKQVNHWRRTGIDSAYIDLDSTDAAGRTYVEVGLFADSTTGKYGAMLVNTRFWPSLRDSVDIHYYNDGLPDSSKSQSTLGDIDVRKVYMKIDTLQFGAAFRSDYYVVRDLWHPDTTWLVKADSNFAIYLKPGDAKFLYFEKAYSILVSKTGATGSQEFAFNNGRRVAERKRGTQTVTTYTRNHKLYVSYAAKGKTFGGYAEHSDQDNIATGNEEALDTARYCSRPSIIVGSNDSSVAIAYFVKVSSDSGYIRIAYQNGPGATWKYANFTGESFADSSTDLHQVTPVVTQGNNKNYVVLATNRTGHSAPYTVVGFRFKYESDNTLHLQSNSTVLYTDATKECLFPTVASRPLDSTFWPIRYAWQRDQHIYYAQARDTVFSDANVTSNSLQVNPAYR
jgi:hypothetical protein